MFESKERLAKDIETLLDALRLHVRGRWACIVEPRGLLFESGESASPDLERLRAHIERRRAAIFSIPEAMASGGPMQDAFEGWDEDEFLLAFLNGRVAAIVACPDAERARQECFEVVKALVDRLLRYDERWRLDAQGRGLFFGRPKLDLIAVGAGSAG